MDQPNNRGRHLTESADVGVLWQAQAEAPLASMRWEVREAMLPGLDADEAALRAALAQAHATAAVALATLLTVPE